MKIWTIQLDLEEGSDEFWESNPTPEQIIRVINDELNNTCLYTSNLKVVKIIDNNEYNYYEVNAISE